MRSVKMLLVAALMFIVAGCAGMTPTEQRMLSGGAIGAGTGAAIGGLTGGDAGAGAAIGGAAGVIGGAIVDQHERRRFNEPRF
jgi:hypothetical protein